MIAQDTATQLNRLLLQLDAAAAALPDGEYPRLEARMELSLRPVCMHCAACGALFPLAPGGQPFYCPACAATTCTAVLDPATR